MDTGPLPEIFGDLVSFADSSKELTTSLVEEYCSTIQGDHSLLPEFLATVGPSVFLDLVCSLGGQNIRIPRAEDILKKANNAGK